jgi:hypothetical protein
MAKSTPSGPFTFTSSVRFPSEYLPTTPGAFSFKPGFGASSLGSKSHSPRNELAIIFEELSTHWVIATALPILFLHATVGKLVLAPICGQLIFYLVTEVVGLSSRISDNLAALREHEERKARAIGELATARAEHEAFQLEQQACIERLSTANEKNAVENADLRTKIQSIAAELEEKCNAQNAHDKQVAALKAKMETDRTAAASTQLRLETMIFNQAGVERGRRDELESVKQQLAQAQNDLLSRRAPPQFSYTAERRPTLSKAPPPRASQLPYNLPEDLMTLDPLSAGFTCIGITQKGSRCRQSYISNHAKTAAKAQLEIVRSGKPGNAFEMPQLQELASWMLCPRWHNDTAQCPQDRQVASRWYRELKSAREAMASLDRPVFSTPVKRRPTLLGSAVSGNSSTSSTSSASSLFSAGSYESASSVATSPESSPLARKSLGLGYGR